jgi:oligo-1,6-glucosidase
VKNDWWKKAVVYQVYPRSFCDSNGDGIGDINGITSKLGYLKELGVDVIWISPVYQSPMRDNGYDISDYCAINPEFGTMADFDRLLEKAHALKLKIIMDLVVNHSSNEHSWFQESRSSPDNPKRNYYIWRDGRSEGGQTMPPNNWKAWFGGSAWSKDEATGQYYLHLFSPWQPDLNWDNPALRNEVYDMMRFWLDKGIDGFRLDAISFISKPEKFTDGNVKQIIPNGPRIHEYLQEMRQEVLSKYDIMTVGETGGVTVDEAVQYANKDGTELDMVFQFETVELDGGETFKWNDRKIILTELKEVLSRWQNKLHDRAWNSLYWCNHDQPRIVSRLGCEGNLPGDAGLREKSAKMLATCLHFLQGTPYIYQGEELGMTNTPFSDISEYRDLECINAYNTLVLEEKLISKEDMLRFMGLKSRDTSRTPMHWNNRQNAGFMPENTVSPATEPWIKINQNYTEINAEEQMRRPGSVFSYYQELIKLRKTMDIITNGNFELLLPDHSDLFVYTRKLHQKKLLVVCNFISEERIFVMLEGFNGKDVLITNEDASRSYTTVVDSQGYKQRPSVVLGPYGAVVYQS